MKWTVPLLGPCNTETPKALASIWDEHMEYAYEVSNRMWSFHRLAIEASEFWFWPTLPCLAHFGRFVGEDVGWSHCYGFSEPTPTGPINKLSTNAIRYRYSAFQNFDCIRLLHTSASWSICTLLYFSLGLSLRFPRYWTVSSSVKQGCVCADAITIWMTSLLGITSTFDNCSNDQKASETPTESCKSTIFNPGLMNATQTPWGILMKEISVLGPEINFF